MKSESKYPERISEMLSDSLYYGALIIERHNSFEIYCDGMKMASGTFENNGWNVVMGTKKIFVES